MNNQDFINMVEQAIDKLNKQGKLSKDLNSGKCYYLKDNGHCCIIGHMMPNDKTRKQADGYSGNSGTDVYSLFAIGFKWPQQFEQRQVILLQYLQDLHDEGGNFDSIIEKMYDELETYKM